MDDIILVLHVEPVSTWHDRTRAWEMWNYLLFSKCSYNNNNKDRTSISHQSIATVQLSLVSLKNLVFNMSLNDLGKQSFRYKTQDRITSSRTVIESSCDKYLHSICHRATYSSSGPVSTDNRFIMFIPYLLELFKSPARILQIISRSNPRVRTHHYGREYKYKYVNSYSSVFWPLVAPFTHHDRRAHHLLQPLYRMPKYGDDGISSSDLWAFWAISYQCGISLEL